MYGFSQENIPLEIQHQACKYTTVSVERGPSCLGFARNNPPQSLVGSEVEDALVRVTRNVAKAKNRVALRLRCTGNNNRNVRDEEKRAMKDR